MSFNSKSVFQLNDKNITLEGLGHVKDAIDFVLQNVKSIHGNKDNKEFARVIGSIDFEDKEFIRWIKNFN